MASEEEEFEGAVSEWASFTVKSMTDTTVARAAELKFADWLKEE